MFWTWVQVLFFVGILVCLTPLLGNYIARVFSGTVPVAAKSLGWLENLSYRLSRIHPKEEMTWTEYGKALLIFNIFGMVTLILIQRLQGYLPLNPQNFEAVPWGLSFNTAISFVTNTNWQAYAGETTLSNFTQMIGLTSQNFLSAATGMGALLTLIRGLTRKSMETVGNFWADLVRMIVYILLPLSLVLALILVSEGVIQTFSSYKEVITLENAKQVIPLGPVASQVAIKQLGTNGGGFFGANSAHPFENPTPLSNFFEMLSIMLIPASSLYFYGIMMGSKKQAWMLFIAPFVLWGGGLLISFYSENIHNAIIGFHPLLEGQETRFGLVNSVLWSVSTTATANGSVNSMISSLSPLAGGVALVNILLGELIFGGLGVGICRLIMFILLAVFLSGLMVGRTPEYLGKKIEKKEILWVMMAILAPTVLVLVGASITSVWMSDETHLGPHGLSEILYAFASAAGNNGSAFAGLNTNTNYYNVILGIVMGIGRLSIILPSLALAGLFAKKKITPSSVGTFSTDSPLFVILLLSVIIIIAGLAYFPVLSLGPIAEHLLMIEAS